MCKPFRGDAFVGGKWAQSTNGLMRIEQQIACSLRSVVVCLISHESVADFK